MSFDFLPGFRGWVNAKTPVRADERPTALHLTGVGQSGFATRWVFTGCAAQQLETL